VAGLVEQLEPWLFIATQSPGFDFYCHYAIGSPMNYARSIDADAIYRAR